MTKILVIGESCTDQYVYGTCDRVCPEAAALCFKHNGDITSNPGMAGTIYGSAIFDATSYNSGTIIPVNLPLYIQERSDD